MSWDLEAILEYEMDELQSKAFKLALLWEILVEKEFPNHQHVKLRKDGDPRKSYLFKTCYKLVRDTKGLIPDPEYRLYLLAQLHVLKNISTDARIDPNSLTGRKAWVRWKVWKRLYDRNYNNYKQNILDAKPVASFNNVTSSLQKTKIFLTDKFGRQPTYEDVEKSLKDHSMVKWVTMQRVAPYYVLLSPWIHKILEGEKWEDIFLFDLSVYKSSINEEVKKFFNYEFGYEQL